MTQMTPPADLTAEQKAKQAKARNQAYTAATTRLREKHDEDFQTLYGEELQARGLPHTPRLTPDQRAKQDILRLAETHKIDLATLLPAAGEPAPADA